MANLTFTEQTDNISSEIVKEDKTNVDVLKLKNIPDSTSIAISDVITYKDKSATTIFTGIVQSLKQGSGGKEAEVFDNGSQLLQRNVNELFTSQSPEAIIQSVITTYTTLTYVSTITSGITIPIYKARNKKAWDIVTELSELLLANFYTDKNSNFQLELVGENTSSKFINTSIATLDGDWKEDKTTLINSLTVEGDRQVFEKTQLFSGTGAQTEFTLAEIPIDVKVSISGTDQDGYVEGQGSGDYTVDKETKKIIFDTAPASGTDNISVEYTYSFPISVRRRDKTSIDTYGQHDKSIPKPYIKTRTEARKFCEFILDRFKNPLLTSTWIMTSNTEYDDFESFLPNEIITVNDTRTGISGDYVIKKVVRKFGSDAGLFITVGDIDNDILFWQKEVQERIKQLEERDDNSDFLNEDELVSETIKLQFDADFSSITKRTWETDAFYLNSYGAAVRNQMLNDGTGPVMYNTDTGAYVTTTIYPSDEVRLTENGTDIRITENIDTRITEAGGSIATTGVVTNYAMNLAKTDFITDWGTLITHIATGDDNTTPTVSDTTLANETIREVTFEEDSSSLFVSASMFQDAADNNGNTIEEVGLFDAGSGGNMYVRSLTNVITKSSTIESFIEIKINVMMENSTTLNT